MEEKDDLMSKVKFMKTKEKSLEQEVLEDHSWKSAMKNYQKASNRIGVITGILSCMLYIVASIICHLPLHGIEFSGIVVAIFVLAFLSILFGMTAMAISLPFTRGHFISDKWRKKFINSLSQEKKREIILAAITKQIEDCQKSIEVSNQTILSEKQNIIDIEREIEELQKESKKC